MPLKVYRFHDPAWRAQDATVPDEVQQIVAADFIPPAGLLLVGVDDETPEKVIATAGFRRATDLVCDVRNLVVFWGYQSRGIGRLMFDALRAHALHAGYQGIRAEVADSIPALITFYEKMGFSRAPPQFQRPGFVRLERPL
jgi:GNAT superfamily N-acetyltransferase